MTMQSPGCADVAAAGHSCDQRSHTSWRLPIPEAVKKTAEEAPLTKQRRAGRRRGRPLPGDRLVIVGPRDRVDDLLLVEVVGAFDLRHITDKYTVLHHLSLKASSAVGIPLRFTAVVQRHAHPELIHPDLRQVAVDAAVAQRIDHSPCPILVHSPN